MHTVLLRDDGTGEPKYETRRESSFSTNVPGLTERLAQRDARGHRVQDARRGVHLVAGRLSDPAARAKGILLDGFPRTADQATALLARVQIDQVILIDVPDKSLIARAAERRAQEPTAFQ